MKSAHVLGCIIVCFVILASPKHVGAVPANNPWSVSTVYTYDKNTAEASWEIAVAVTDDHPIVFSVVVQLPEDWSVIALQPDGKRWKSEPVALPAASASNVTLDAQTVGDRAMLAINAFHQGDNAIEIRSLAKKKWLTEFSEKGRTVYGRVQLGRAGDRQFATFCDGGEFPRRLGAVRLLERVAEGKWMNCDVPIPQITEFRGSSLSALDKDPLLALRDQRMVHVGVRRDGKWAFSNFVTPWPMDTHFMPSNAGLVAVARNKWLSFSKFQNNQWQDQRLDLNVPAEANITVSHSASIGGKAMLVFFDETSATNNLLTWDGGQWSEQIVKTVAPIKDVREMRLFEWKGQPTIVVRTRTELLLLSQLAH